MFCDVFCSKGFQTASVLLAGQRTAGKETVEKNKELADVDLVGGTDTSGKEYAVSDAEKKQGGEDVAADQALAADKVQSDNRAIQLCRSCFCKLLKPSLHHLFARLSHLL